MKLHSSILHYIFSYSRLTFAFKNFIAFTILLAFTSDVVTILCCRRIALFEMAGTANTDMTDINVDLDSSSFIIPSSQELQDTSRNNFGDIFLTIQSATTTVSKIYTEYFALSRLTFSPHC